QDASLGVIQARPPRYEADVSSMRHACYGRVKSCRHISRAAGRRRLEHHRIRSLCGGDDRRVTNQLRGSKSEESFEDAEGLRYASSSAFATGMTPAPKMRQMNPNATTPPSSAMSVTSPFIADRPLSRSGRNT